MANVSVHSKAALYLQEMRDSHSKNVSWSAERIPVIGAFFSLYVACSEYQQYNKYAQREKGAGDELKNVFTQLKGHHWDAVKRSACNVATLGLSSFFGYFYNHKQIEKDEHYLKVMEICLGAITWVQCAEPVSFLLQDGHQFMVCREDAGNAAEIVAEIYEKKVNVQSDSIYSGITEFKERLEDMWDNHGKMD